MIPKIQVRGLSKSFGSKIVLDHIDLDLMPGESFCLIGGSGTGKSVLIKCILGLLQPDSGHILINGIDINTLNRRDRQAMLAKFGMLFQGGALFDSLPVWQNISFGLMHQKKVGRKEAKEIAIELLSEVNLDAAIADVYPAELSGGMQKRVSLARAIACKPDVIFFDEPTTGLDPIVSGSINNLIIKCVRHLGASAITITHDLNSLRCIADRVGLLFQGKMIWVGTLDELETTDNPYVVQFINGNAEGPFTLL
ncbi:ABC transporter ATP-binding protein [Candidatus Paracaedibacter symbiosus]|uniref:ABC transporter ATP-binding protein n=1 Tax=Candidatus Paracaedibacter symbiosus TaxID=244582 RepID=UPI000509C856|nr:ATP-binding cassette domain-containing protein [Candidatus Paracaedibacter symbiosus]